MGILAKVAGFLLVGIISGCSLLYCTSHRETTVLERLVLPDGGEFQLILYPGRGDGMSSVISGFYKRPGMDRWQWYYVDHEGPVRGWSTELIDDGGYISVESLGSEKLVVEAATGFNCTHDKANPSRTRFWSPVEPGESQYPLNARPEKVP